MADKDSKRSESNDFWTSEPAQKIQFGAPWAHKQQPQSQRPTLAQKGQWKLGGFGDPQVLDDYVANMQRDVFHPWKNLQPAERMARAQEIIATILKKLYPSMPAVQFSFAGRETASMAFSARDWKIHVRPEYFQASTLSAAAAADIASQIAHEVRHLEREYQFYQRAALQIAGATRTSVNPESAVDALRNSRLQNAQFLMAGKFPSKSKVMGADLPTRMILRGGAGGDAAFASAFSNPAKDSGEESEALWQSEFDIEKRKGVVAHQNDNSREWFGAVQTWQHSQTNPAMAVAKDAATADLYRVFAEVMKSDSQNHLGEIDAELVEKAVYRRVYGDRSLQPAHERNPLTFQAAVNSARE